MGSLDAHAERAAAKVARRLDKELKATSAADVWRWQARLVGFCYVITLVSLLPQLPGLIGPRGVFPAGDVVAMEREAVPGRLRRWLRFPTVFHAVAPTAANLRLVAAAGALGGAGAAAGVDSRLPLAVAVGSFLSLCTVGGEFLAYPWDALLLEAGFLGVLLETGGRPQHGPVRFAHRFLAFRLMWGMGLQKFYAVDRSTSEWWRGTYLATFYHWQPMPTPLAWWAHNASARFHALACGVVGFSQCVLPLGFFLGPAVRRLNFAVVVLEQAWIQATGNYGVFNVLTVVVCFCALWERPAPESAQAKARRPTRRGFQAVIALLASTNVCGGAFFLARRGCVGLQTTDYPWLSASPWLYDDAATFGPIRQTLRYAYPVARPAATFGAAAARAAAPWRACNDYGIFRTGAGAALKLVVSLEGEARGTRGFAPLVFKTGRQCATGGAAADAARQLPGWFAPHQPRLDHSMFYAGHGTSIAKAVAHEQHHLAPIATPGALLAHAAAGLLDGDAASLLAWAPANVTRLRVGRARCFFGDQRPPLAGPVPWTCEAAGRPRDLPRPPPETLDARRAALAAGLDVEAATTRPSRFVRWFCLFYVCYKVRPPFHAFVAIFAAFWKLT